MSVLLSFGCGERQSLAEDAGAEDGGTSSTIAPPLDAGAPDAGITGWCTESGLDAVCFLESGFLHTTSSLSDGGTRATMIGSLAEVGISLRFDVTQGGTAETAFAYIERECAGPLCRTRCEYRAAPPVAAGLHGGRVEGSFTVPSMAATVDADGGCPSRSFDSRFGFAR